MKFIPQNPRTPGRPVSAAVSQLPRPVYLVCLVFLFLALAGCSPLTMVNTIAPDDGFVLDKAIGYGPHERQKLDVYHPEVHKPETPVLVFFYGGSWLRGDRQKYRFIGCIVLLCQFFNNFYDFL